MATRRMKTFLLFIFSTILLQLTACSTPSQIMADAEVRRLCEKDGGIKVYETVRLSIEQYKRYTQFLKIVPYQNLKEDDEFYLVWNTSKLKEGSPSIGKSHFQLIRRSDSKILGEAINYWRRGGDVPGPWHDSSYMCQDRPTDSVLIQNIFLKKEE